MPDAKPWEKVWSEDGVSLFARWQLQVRVKSTPDCEAEKGYSRGLLGGGGDINLLREETKNTREKSDTRHQAHTACNVRVPGCFTMAPLLYLKGSSVSGLMPQSKCDTGEECQKAEQYPFQSPAFSVQVRQWQVV